jgi:hypothetical protein
MPVEQLDELRKIRQRSGQAVDLVDHDDVDLADPHVLQMAKASPATDKCINRRIVLKGGAALVAACPALLRGGWRRSREPTAQRFVGSGSILRMPRLQFQVILDDAVPKIGWDVG